MQPKRQRHLVIPLVGRSIFHDPPQNLGCRAWSRSLCGWVMLWTKINVFLAKHFKCSSNLSSVDRPCRDAQLRHLQQVEIEKKYLMRPTLNPWLYDILRAREWASRSVPFCKQMLGLQHNAVASSFSSPISDLSLVPLALPQVSDDLFWSLLVAKLFCSSH